jgi:hypothetical protein
MPGHKRLCLTTVSHWEGHAACQYRRVCFGMKLIPSNPISISARSLNSLSVDRGQLGACGRKKALCARSAPRRRKSVGFPSLPAELMAEFTVSKCGLSGEGASGDRFSQIASGWRRRSLFHDLEEAVAAVNDVTARNRSWTARSAWRNVLRCAVRARLLLARPLGPSTCSSVGFPEYPR